MKIIDKILSRTTEAPFYSFEYFPPKTEAGLYNLYSRLDRMAQLEPLFVDVTWGAGGSTADQTLEIARNIQSYFGVDVMMHLTCTNMPESTLRNALDQARDGGISNILALRGDPPEGQKEWKPSAEGFRYGSDLTKFIRQNYQDTFGIGVGAYPEGHTEATSLTADINHLKIKIDAGADFIITQLFYDIHEYLNFVKLCRSAGITCPIVPGLLPITNYERFLRFTRFCQTKVPKNILADLESIKKDDAAVKRYGIKQCVEMCEKLRDFGVPGFHFYTLNLETTVMEVLKQLQLIDNFSNRRTLPWRPSTMPGRREESVRPIYWSNRPKSYMARTAGWDDFPNGRWGDSRSPTFGDLNEYYLIRQGLEGTKVGKDVWQEPKDEKDIKNVFTGFLKGDVESLPWCDEIPKSETAAISDSLVALNQAGFLTINSQPQVNGTPSSDPHVGWGGDNGYVYQKAYIEFFVSPEDIDRLLACVEKFPSLTFQATNHAGDYRSNMKPDGVNAVTWGVFPGKEVIQPTVVDSESFMIWKEEAFQLWLSDGANLYPKSHPSRELLKKIHSSYYLVNLVENDFVSGNIFSPFQALARSFSSSHKTKEQVPYM